MDLKVALDRPPYFRNKFLFIVIKHLEPETIKWVGKDFLEIKGANPHLNATWNKILEEYREKTRQNMKAHFQEIHFTPQEKKNLKALILGEELQ